MENTLNLFAKPAPLLSYSAAAPSFITEMKECISDAYVHYDLEWRFLDINSLGEKLMRCKKSDVLGRVLWEAFPFLCGTNVETKFREAMRSKQMQQLELEYEPSSAHYAMRAYPMPDGLIVLFQDIRDFRNGKERVELQETVRALKVSQEQLSMAIKSARVGFYDWDLVSDRFVMSEQFYHELGIKKEDIVTRSATIRDFIHPEDWNRVLARVKRAIAGEEPYDIEYRLRGSKGETLWMSVRGEVVYSEDGKPLRFFGSAVNITEQKRIQAELEKARLEAEQANSSKSVFLANMSHEIRTPLDAILGFADLLKNSEISRDEHKQYVDIISRSGRCLARIIDDILDLSKVEAGKMTLENSEFSLQDLIEDVLHLFQERARSKNLELIFDSKGCPSSNLQSDPARIRQVLVNLVGNALKFTSAGSVRIWVCVAEMESSRLRVTIFVQDSGLGLSAEQAKGLFQPFVQANGQKQKFGGTGLGLMLSRNIAQALGGDVRLHDFAEGKGCTFSAEFVASTTSSAVRPTVEVNAQSMKLSTSKSLEGLKLLIADDSYDNRMLLRILLNREGAIVEEASHGAEAVQKALDGQHDLVLMDIQMPGMDGFGALAALQKRNYRKPVVALTAHVLEAEREKTRKAGFKDHVTKPINQAALVNTILAQVRH